MQCLKKEYCAKSAFYVAKIFRKYCITVKSLVLRSNIVASIEEHFGKVDRIRIIGLGILDPDNNDDSDKQGQYIPSDIEAIFLQLQLALRLRRELSDSFGYGGLHITSEESDHSQFIWIKEPDSAAFSKLL